MVARLAVRLLPVVARCKGAVSLVVARFAAGRCTVAAASQAEKYRVEAFLVVAPFPEVKCMAVEFLEAPYRAVVLQVVQYMVEAFLVVPYMAAGFQAAKCMVAASAVVQYMAVESPEAKCTVEESPVVQYKAEAFLVEKYMAAESLEAGYVEG